MLTVLVLLLIVALILTIYSVVSKSTFPLWPAVLILVIVGLLNVIPLK